MIIRTTYLMVIILLLLLLSVLPANFSQATRSPSLKKLVLLQWNILRVVCHAFCSQKCPGINNDNCFMPLYPEHPVGLKQEMTGHIIIVFLIILIAVITLLHLL